MLIAPAALAHLDLIAFAGTATILTFAGMLLAGRRKPAVQAGYRGRRTTR